MLAGPPLKTNGFPAARVAALNSWISGLGNDRSQHWIFKPNIESMKQDLSSMKTAWFPQRIFGTQFLISLGKCHP